MFSELLLSVISRMPEILLSLVLHNDLLHRWSSLWELKHEEEESTFFAVVCLIL